MRLATIFFFTGLLGATVASAQITSVRLTDSIRSKGSGTVDLFKDIDAAQLEALRADNGGLIVLGVDVNESSSGTEKSSTQAVTVKSVILTVTFQDGSQIVYGSEDDWFTETITFVAEDPDTERLEHYTLLGESGSSRITPNGTDIQESFDSTLKIRAPDTLYDTSAGIQATSAIIEIELLDTNGSLGDPELFYDYTNGFEDLAVLNAVDTAFIDDYSAGIEEAPLVLLTNPPTTTDPMTVTSWNYFPSATAYYLVGYEDLYPQKGDYDFNDLTVAYQVRFGINSDNRVVSIRGSAYLLTRGAGYNHKWRLRIDLPAGASAGLSCSTFLDPQDDYALQDCDSSEPNRTSGTADIVMFDQTGVIFPAPPGDVVTNTRKGQAYEIGPKSTFRLDFDTPLSLAVIADAPFDPYLTVLNTGENVQLLQVNPEFKDENGFPFGMLLPSQWLPPNEYFDISDVYPRFDTFVTSGGTSDQDWSNNYKAEVVVPVPEQSLWAW
jgi:LruC domain-containing protein